MVRKGFIVIAALLCSEAFAKPKPRANPNMAIIAEAKAALAETLLDPSSAQYRNVGVHRSQIGPLVCGEYNAKNRFGGYVGFQTFVYGDGSLLDEEAADYGEISLNCYRK
ncbi:MULTISPECIES: hypothetical protein [unclassified Sphingomonas]|uniref:hypothetical protein n=1 Tax=unclassified Sphingomonas TaxID=196159 RepID=UPI0012E3D524|nr:MULTISPECIES: hypothetical protein [unclassified Sphingomonas]